MPYIVRMSRDPSPPTPWTPRRCTLAVIGVLFVILGAIGIMVPGLPGAVFLLLASWCFAKSFPSLEQRLLRNRFFGPYMHFVDGDAPLPAKDKAFSIALMWASTIFSVWFLWFNDLVPPWVLPIVGGGAVVGTVVILRRGNAPRKSNASNQVPAPVDGMTPPS